MSNQLNHKMAKYINDQGSSWILLFDLGSFEKERNLESMNK